MGFEGTSRGLKSSVENFEGGFTLDTSREGVSIYVFKNVAVVIDRRGKNVSHMPELMFGTFKDIPGPEMLSQPPEPVERVSMEYVVACIQKAACADGEGKYWIHPYGDDVEEENRERREAARLRLFARYAHIEPDPSGFGYVLEITSEN